MFSNSTKGILSLIGACLFHFIYGTQYVWSNINSYYASYLYYNGNDIKPTDTTMLMPIIVLIKVCVLYFGLTLGYKYGFKLPILLSSILIFLTYLLLFLSISPNLLILGMALSGLAEGIGALSLLKNVWLFFNGHEGKVTGAIFTSVGAGACIMSAVADLVVINPEHAPTDSLGYYPEDVANNLHKFLGILLVAYTTISLISFFIIFPNKEKESTDNKNVESNVNTNDMTLSSVSSDYDKNISSSNDYISGSFSEGFFSKKNLELSLFLYCGPFFCYLLINSCRNLGNLNGISQYAINLIAILFGIVNGSSRIISGYLFDLFSFKKTMFFITAVELIVSITVYFASNNDILYVIENTLIAFCLGSTFTMMPPLYEKIFGKIQGLKIYSITAISGGICSVIGALMVKYLVKEITDYFIMFLIGSMLIVLQGINIIFLDDNQFLYRKAVTNYVFKYNKNTLDKSIESSGDFN